MQHFLQLRNRPVTRGVQGGKDSYKFFAPFEKCVEQSYELFNTAKKVGTLSENSSPPMLSQAGYGLVEKALAGLKQSFCRPYVVQACHRRMSAKD